MILIQTKFGCFPALRIYYVIFLHIMYVVIDFFFFLATVKKKKVEFTMLNVSCFPSLYLFFLGLWVSPIQEKKKKKSDIFSFTTFRWILENCLMPRNISWPMHVHIYLSSPCNVPSATQRFGFFFFFPSYFEDTTLGNFSSF